MFMGTGWLHVKATRLDCEIGITLESRGWKEKTEEEQYMQNLQKSTNPGKK